MPERNEQDNHNHLIEDVKGIIGRAGNIAIVTGAGISAESGIPTFRGDDGYWHGIEVMAVASLPMFQARPDILWDFCREKMWADALAAEPNAGHMALAQLCEDVRDPGGDCSIFTQNIDGLHSRARAANVYEMHGTLFTIFCDGEDCGFQTPYVDACDQFDMTQGVPTCPECGENLRPKAILFGEGLDYDLVAQATYACCHADVFISVGTSSIVAPVSMLHHYAQMNDATIIEVNPEDTPLSVVCDYKLQGTACDILPQLVR